MKTLTVTDKQLNVIKNACELYGRIQIGQFNGFAEIVTQTGFYGWQLRVQPDRKEDESDERYKARCDDMEERDRLICDCIKGAVDGICRQAYYYDHKKRPNEADIALDIWAKLDGRREGIDFSMSREPLVQVKDEEE